MRKSLLAGMLTEAGRTKPILVFTTDVVNAVFTPLTTISPSIGKSLKLLNP